MSDLGTPPQTRDRVPYLYAWNFRENAAWFIEMDREDFHNSIFLDQRIAAKQREVTPRPIDTVLGENVEEREVRKAFIFHTAFCCSTLLARSLDRPGQTMVYREPMTLLQLADLKRGLSGSGHDWNPLLKTTLHHQFYGTAFEDRVLIKPTNLANNLLPDLIRLYPDARFLLLHDELEPFLVSVLKRPAESMTGIQQFLNRFLLDTPPGNQSVVTQARGKLHYQAALAWALQKRYLTAVLHEHPESIRTLCTPKLLEQPAGILTATSAWLGLDFGGGHFADIASSPLWNRNAKHPGKHYDARQRAREQHDLRKRLADPIAEATEWLAHDTGLFPATFRQDLELKTGNGNEL